MSAWTKFATQFFHNKQKNDPDYKFSQALKAASKVYKKTKGGSSKNCGGAVDPNKTNKYGKPCTDPDDANDPSCQETPDPEAAKLEAAKLEAAKLEAAKLEAAKLEAAKLEAVDTTTTTTTTNPDAVSVATANIDKQQINATMTNGDMKPINDNGEESSGGGKKSKRKSKKAGKKSQKKQKKAKKAGSKKSKK
uniref:Uncharacterized protein n=1 Tax=viral metagenome TaxID=1070528 RepID=A0A6C0ET64_9ZZZZ